MAKCISLRRTWPQISVFSKGLLRNTQPTCRSVPNPSAHMHKYPRHPQPTTYKDQLTRFPTMSSTILSWREDIGECTKAEGNKKLPQKFRLPLSEDLESGSCKRVCTWHRFAPQEHVSAGHCSGPHRFEESIAKQRLNIYIKGPAHHLRISLRMFICL